ncbi:YdaU family protein [Brucella pseudogrignonensis]|uniref:YdaU family protein n=1 Tax=Brucella pseudogrignonensis TaxID=419475 RepID=UPI0038B65744
MSSTPFMQLYVSDYLGDTMHLTTEQHGAYLLLLMTMWRQGGSLPNDPSKLARIARVTARRWHLIAAEVMEFFDVSGDEITQKRLVEEYQKAVSIREKRSVSGKRGAQAKSLKNNDEAPAIAKQVPQHSQKPEPYITTDVVIKETRERDFASEFESQFWPLYPNKVGKPVARTAFLKARKKADLETIIAGLRAYVSKTDDRAWCNPSTWLNQERWTDAPAQVTRGTSPPGQNGPVMMADLTGALMRQMTDRRDDERDSENRSTIETSYSGGDHGASAPAFRLTAPEGRR